jgi:hypothetical protein
VQSVVPVQTALPVTLLSRLSFEQFRQALESEQCPGTGEEPNDSPLES